MSIKNKVSELCMKWFMKGLHLVFRFSVFIFEPFDRWVSAKKRYVLDFLFYGGEDSFCNKCGFWELDDDGRCLRCEMREVF